MANSFPLIIFSAVYIFLLIGVFFRKERIDTPELNIFGSLVLINFAGLVLEILCYIFIRYLPINHFLTILVNKLYLIHFILFTSTFLIYTHSVSVKREKYEQDKKKILSIYKKILIVSAIIILILPIKLSYGDKIYSYGMAVDFIYMYSTVMVCLCILEMLLHIKTVKIKKYFTLIIYIVATIIVAFVQKANPELTLSTVLDSLVIYIMYFTLENPDVKMINQLNLAKNNAERANEAKTDFLSSMSHEIRTPLNAIVGFSNSILEDETLEAAKAEAKDIIMASQNLLEIVNGILDISKIEAGKMEIVEVEYRPHEVFNNIAKLIKPRIGEKAIELKTNFSPDIPAVLYGDMAKVREIVTNLLTNAVKYTEKGIIDLSVQCINTKNKSKLVISIEDTGRGIKPDKIDKLFTKFQRLEEDKNTTLEGTGLGLAITKSLVEMMGGKIVVQSKYGSGSKFTVYLEQKIIKMIEDKKKEEVKNTDEYDYSNKKILIVDDNMLNIKVATRLLKNYKIIPDNVLSGKECIDKVRENTYDLILMDDMMPNMSGTETLKKLKENQSFDTPVVVLTANAISGMKENYLKSGFTDYLAKPIDKLELERILKEFLK